MINPTSRSTGFHSSLGYAIKDGLAVLYFLLYVKDQIIFYLGLICVFCVFFNVKKWGEYEEVTHTYAFLQDNCCWGWFPDNYSYRSEFMKYNFCCTKNKFLMYHFLSTQQWKRSALKGFWSLLGLVHHFSGRTMYLRHCQIAQLALNLWCALNWGKTEEENQTKNYHVQVNLVTVRSFVCEQ